MSSKNNPLGQNVSLPFSKAKQRAILGHALADPKFFAYIRVKLEPEWFTEDMLAGRVFGEMQSFYERFKHNPTEAEILDSAKLRVEIGDVAAINKLVGGAQAARRDYSQDALKAELGDWMASVIYFQSLTKADQAYNAGQFQQVRSVFEKTSKDIAEINFDESHICSFDDVESLLDEQAQAIDNGLTTGFPLLDKAILSTAQTGALLPGGHTCFVASTGVGKTTSMLNISLNNVLAGKKAIYVSLEGEKGDIITKSLQFLLNQTAPELFANYRTPEGRRAIENAQGLLRRNFKYIHYRKPGATIEDLEIIIRRANDDFIDETGSGTDLLVVDYPALLMSRLALKGGWNRRDKDRHIYLYVGQLGADMGCHVLSAIQTNREGSKVNKGTARDPRLVVPEDVAEAWEVICDVPTAITINRSPFAQAHEFSVYLVAKTRGNDSGVAVVAKTDFARAQAFNAELGGCWYKDTGNYDEKIPVWLTEYAGRQIPVSVLYV